MSRSPLLATLPLLGTFTGCDAFLPPASTPPTASTAASVVQATPDEWFKITAAAGNPSVIRQGETRTLRFTILRGRDFKDDVGLSHEGPLWIRVEHPDAVLASGDGSVEVKVTTQGDAAVGEHVVKLIGTPEKGVPASLEFKVAVASK